MANEKILNTRIQLKYDNYENWSKTDEAGKGANLVLKEGEVGICYIPEKTEVNGIKNPPHVMLKVGDGTTPFASLKWLSARAADVEDWAKAETKPTYSAEEIIGIGDYIANYVDETLGITVDTNTLYQIVKSGNTYKLQSKAAGTDAWADVSGSEITLPESTKVEASTTNGNIKVDGEEVKVYDDVFHTDMLIVDKFGGIASGANLNGKTTHQILTDLLYPYIAFVINSASRSTAAATLECGQTQTLSSATISVTKKKDPIQSITLYNGSTILETKTGEAVANGGSITFNSFSPITITKDNNPNLKFTVTDGTTSTDKNVGASTFVYPYYWGICDKDATINETLVEGLTKKVQNKANSQPVTFTCANQRMVFAYPKKHGALVSILDPNGFENLSDYARSEVSITGLDGSAQTYYVYVSGAGSATDFKVTFKLTK